MVVVFGLGAMHPQHPHFFGKFVVVGDHQPAISISSKVLGGEEGETAEVSDRPDLAALVFGPNGLGCVFDHIQVVFFSQTHDLVHIGGLAIEVNRDYRADCDG